MSDEIDGEDLNPILDAIDSAEEIPDPLDGLVEKSAEDPGAAFTPEVLERLVALKSEDRAAFEALRARLKKAGCRVTALDEAMAEESGDGGRGPTQADILIDLAGAAELFHSADGTALADILINEHRETWPVRTKGFRRWLARQFFEQTGGAPSSEALQSALNVIEAKALGALGEAAGERIAKSKTWPDSPRALSGRLRRAASFLRKIGIEVSFEREGQARTRIIRITAAGADPLPERGGVQPSAPSVPSAPRPKSIPDNDFAAPDPRTVANDADGRASGPVDSARANPLKFKDETQAAAGQDALPMVPATFRIPHGFPEVPLSWSAVPLDRDMSPEAWAPQEATWIAEGEFEPGRYRVSTTGPGEVTFSAEVEIYPGQNNDFIIPPVDDSDDEASATTLAGPWQVIGVPPYQVQAGADQLLTLAIEQTQPNGPIGGSWTAGEKLAGPQVAGREGTFTTATHEGDALRMTFTVGEPIPASMTLYLTPYGIGYAGSLSSGAQGMSVVMWPGG